MSPAKIPLPVTAQLHHFADEQKLAKSMAASVAQLLLSAIEQHGRASLVVSGGRTPVALFKHLSGQPLDWSKVTVSLADERWLPVTHDGSNEALVRQYLLQGPAQKARFMGLYQASDSVESCAAKAELALAELPMPIDVLLLGMGDDGHTASLFPNSPNLSAAMEAHGTRKCWAMRAPSVPHQRLSLSLSVLAAARSTLLLIQGQNKRSALREALAGDDPLQMPIRAFMGAPLSIYWCP